MSLAFFKKSRINSNTYHVIRAIFYDVNKGKNKKLSLKKKLKSKYWSPSFLFNFGLKPNKKRVRGPFKGTVHFRNNLGTKDSLDPPK